ncbi:MAG: hypothetical protein HY644_06155 [Acidobacteria bacterium]|nr:hypothetical protein [Acidobacteriota bacterium]
MSSRRRFFFLGLVVSYFLLRTVLAAPEAEAETGWGIWDTIGRFFNLFLLFGVLIYFVRKPLGMFFENRRHEIEQKLIEAQRRHEEAEAKLREIEESIHSIEQEISEIRQRTQQEIQSELQRLEESSREEAAKIISVAGREIDGMLRAAQKELLRYAGSLSVNLAQEMIRESITPGDQERIFNRFIDHMESLKS